MIRVHKGPHSPHSASMTTTIRRGLVFGPRTPKMVVNHKYWGCDGWWEQAQTSTASQSKTCNHSTTSIKTPTFERYPSINQCALQHIPNPIPHQIGTPNPMSIGNPAPRFMHPNNTYRTTYLFSPQCNEVQHSIMQAQTAPASVGLAEPAGVEYNPQASPCPALKPPRCSSLP